MASNQHGGAMQRLQNQMQQDQQMPGEQIVAGGATMERIQTRYHTAVRVQVPRDKKAVLARVLEECEIMPDGLMYSWTVNNRDGSKAVIEGPSIRMAMTLAREYGNCVVSAEQIAEDSNYWTFEGTYVDLETGFTATRLFRQSKSAIRGKYDVERKLDMAYQIGQSKAIRNAVVNAMPSGILARAQETAKKALAAQLTEGGLQHAVAKMVKVFGKYSVTREHLEKRIGKPLDKCSAEDLADLRNVWSSLEDGHTTAAQEFEMTDQAKADLGKAAAAKAEGKPAEKEKAPSAEEEPPPASDPPEDL